MHGATFALALLPFLPGCVTAELWKWANRAQPSAIVGDAVILTVGAAALLVLLSLDDC